MSRLPFLVLDVDGVLTDGGLPYDEHGQMAKTFHVHDGAALARWRAAGGRFAVLSGRESAAASLRARELGAEAVVMGAGDKLNALRELCARCGVELGEVVCVGDDWPDLAAMQACGYSVAVANAAAALKRAASHVTRRAGGEGGVAEAVEHLMRRAGAWPPAATHSSQAGA